MPDFIKLFTNIPRKKTDRTKKKSIRFNFLPFQAKIDAPVISQNKFEMTHNDVIVQITFETNFLLLFIGKFNNAVDFANTAKKKFFVLSQNSELNFFCHCKKK